MADDSNAEDAGYIVNEEMGGGPSVLLKRDNDVWKNIPRGGVLLSSTREVTIFHTRPAARAAIRRTMAWWHAQRRCQDWPDDAYTIRRVVATEARKRRAF